MAWDVDKMVAADTETHMIEESILAPPPVCASEARLEGGRVVGRLVVGGESRDDKVAAVVGFFRELLSSGATVVGANVAYDFGVACVAEPGLLPLVFDAYATGRVFDVLVAQALHAIRAGDHGLDPRTGAPLKGRYSLDLCAQLVLGRADAKKRDAWRVKYGLLADVAAADWPEDARAYPVDDAVNTLQVALCQVRGGGAGVTPGPHDNLEDVSRQVEAAWALHLGAVWGVRVDPEAVRELRERTERDHAAFLARHARFFGNDGKERKAEVRRAVAVAYGADPSSRCSACAGRGKKISLKSGSAVVCDRCSGCGLDVLPGVPRTAAGAVSTDKETLAESGDADLVAYGENEPEKVRSTYLPWLERGLDRPLTLRPNVLVASGRTSYDGLVQLVPREGGVRECLRARPGHGFLSVDYAAIELCTLAQVCLWLFGRSKMADVIREKGNPGALHTMFAAAMRGVSYDEMAAAVEAGDEVAVRYRWAAKAKGFGSLGGMGTAKFVLTQRRKQAGRTVTPDGTEYPGLRFCVILGGYERCGEQLVCEWRGRETPPLCLRCLEVSRDVLDPAWAREYSDVPEYHRWVSDVVDAGGEVPSFMPAGLERDGHDGCHAEWGSGWAACRVRGGLTFTSAANHPFQSLAADGAKAALRALTREAYLDRGSPLYGVRFPFFVHDESLAEVPLDSATEVADRMVEVMVREMRRWVPDVPVVAEPALMLRWSKKARKKTDARGRLVPWDA